MCRTLERIIIRKFLYPVLVHTDFRHLYRDQFAFRPPGSTTAALMNLVHKISVFLENNEFVHLIGLDFSKAFDSVRHSSLIDKITELRIPSFIHNWVVEYLNVTSSLHRIQLCYFQNSWDKRQLRSRLHWLVRLLTCSIHQTFAQKTMRTTWTSVQTTLTCWSHRQTHIQWLVSFNTCRNGLMKII